MAATDPTRLPETHLALLRSAALVVALALPALAGCQLGSENPGGGDSGGDRPDAGGDVTADGEVGGGPSTREVGQSCNSPNDCLGDASCIGNPDGDYSCMKNCENVWSLCADGAVCTPVANGSPICYIGGPTPRGETCRSNLDCAPGLLCVGTNEEPHYCVEACHADSGGCSGEDFCMEFGNSGKGYCRHQVGAACDNSSECRGDLVCTTGLDAPVSNRFPSGYCTKSGCKNDDDCPGAARCRTYPETSISICFSPCEYPSDCRLAGQYACLDRQECSQSGGADACNAFRDGDDFCVPVDLRSWNQ